MFDAIRNLFASRDSRTSGARKPAPRRLRVEGLGDRILPSGLTTSLPDSPVVYDPAPPYLHSPLILGAEAPAPSGPRALPSGTPEFVTLGAVVSTAPTGPSAEPYTPGDLPPLDLAFVAASAGQPS